MNTMFHKSKDREKKIKIKILPVLSFSCYVVCLGDCESFLGLQEELTKQNIPGRVLFQNISWRSPCCKLRPDRLNHLLTLFLSPL